MEDTENKSTRLPSDWEIPNEWREWALAYGHNNYRISVDYIDEEVIKFKRFHSENNTHQKEDNWFELWKNWCFAFINSKQICSNKPIKNSYQDERNQELRLQAVKLSSNVFVKLYNNEHYYSKEDMIGTMNTILNMADITLEYIKGDI